ncbi:hypothetical protein GCM10011506_08220 [Marivirga lumbricoides]|uniref:VCBS repeat-containing protein n=1 Tax=Marivirga lumbricoides TaxID=1046115 RepID=A0ABQ1LJ11_9BACT|nr:hypothetical protein GCM10011506_08220 [Marivirga lumbricoides]
MKHLTLIFAISLFLISNYGFGQDDQGENYIKSSLPQWLFENNILNGLILNQGYKIDNRLNPLNLQADFNGDGKLDIAVPIMEIKTGKVGFAIIHRKSNEVHILGAGTKVKNGVSDDMSYIDLWKVNVEKVNEAGLGENTGTGEKGELILENPSLQIEKSEVGGGQIYWDGNEYAYFHQTC